jgi:hypothetical protein
MIILRTLGKHELRDVRVEAEKSATKRESGRERLEGNSGLAT